MCRRYFLLLAIFIATANSEKFRVIREWKFLNFTWPDHETYATAVLRGIYIPDHNIISGLDFYQNYYYLTLPRMKDGVPATLVRIPAGKTSDTSPALEPFPSWEMNKEGDCNALQNVQNIEIDPKGQLWIIDSGRTETLETPSSRCPPKLIIFDIKKNMTTTAYTFPESVASLNSNFLYDIVIDDTDAGYAYITDNSARDPGIIVFSVKDHHSWKIRHSKSMRADPFAITFKVNGVIINSPLNLAPIALGPKVHTSKDRIVVDEDREVFYSPISSLHFYSINTTVLRNEQNGMNNAEYQGYVRDCGLKQSQSSGIIMDNQGVLYYTLLGTNSIAKWNSHTPFEAKHRIISRDERFLEWPSAFTFDQNGNITVLVNKLDKFIYDQLNLKEANFRLITSHIGAKSYLFNQAYDYNIEPNATKQTKIESGAPEPEVLPGSNNDPYLVPHPIPERTEPSSVNTESAVVNSQMPQTREGLDPDSEFEMKMMFEQGFEPEYEPKAEPEPQPEPEPKSEPQPEPTTKPVAEPEPEPSNDPKQKHTDHNNITSVTSGTASQSIIFIIHFSAVIGVIIFVNGLFGRT